MGDKVIRLYHYNSKNFAKGEVYEALPHLCSHPPRRRLKFSSFLKAIVFQAMAF